MDSSKQTKNETDEQIRYGKPAVTDYGTLVDITAVGGSVNPSDVPHGLPGSAFPLS